MRIRSVLPAALAATVIIAISGTASASDSGASTALAPRIVAHLDLAAGQQPENLTVLPGGVTAVTFAFARQIAEIDSTGHVRVIATLPAPAPGAITPALTAPFLGGIVRADHGVLYFLYATGTADLTGVWRLAPGGTPERVAALPAEGLANGLAWDQRTGDLYAADSVLGTVWKIPSGAGTAVAWATGGDLTPNGFLGANGIKVHDGAVWVGNLDRGILLRFAIRPDGTAASEHIAATGLTGIDDFAFTGHGDEILAALNASNEIARVADDGSHTIMLDHADGLENPTSVAVQGGRFWVGNAAYLTQQDPNLLTGRVPVPAAR